MLQLLFEEKKNTSKIIFISIRAQHSQKAKQHHSGPSTKTATRQPRDSSRDPASITISCAVRIGFLNGILSCDLRPQRIWHLWTVFMQFTHVTHLQKKKNVFANCIYDRIVSRWGWHGASSVMRRPSRMSKSNRRMTQRWNHGKYHPKEGPLALGISRLWSVERLANCLLIVFVLSKRFLSLGGKTQDLDIPRCLFFACDLLILF